MKVLVFGRGWLGGRLAQHLQGEVVPTDILDTEDVASVLMDRRPDVVINAAGKCGRPNIDWCEASEENKRLTLYVNAFGPAILYHMVEGVSDYLKKKIFFVHLSSGCLWDREYDVSEETAPTPPSWYSKTKVMGEMRLPQDKTLIIRPRMPIDCKPHPRNLVTKLAHYDFVLDEPNSVTFVDDLLGASEYLINARTTGVFNMVNPGPLTAWEIMRLYIELVDEGHACRRVTMDFLNENELIKSGRSNCTLDVSKLKAAGYEMPDAQKKIRACMEAYAKATK